MVPQYDDLDDYMTRRTMNPFLLILGLVAAICGITLFLDVRNPEVAIAIGLIASGAGLVVLAT